MTLSGQDVISACLSQGKYDIHHPHVKPSSHLGSSNLDPNVIPHPQTKAITPHHYSLLLRSIVKQGYSPSVQTPDPVETSTLWLTGDLRVCSPISWDPTSLPTQVPTSSPPSIPSHQKIYTHTQISSFHHLMCILITAISLLC